jgi:pullulanase/glycogen debranching enzyme
MVRKSFPIRSNFDIFEPRYCSLIKITHIRWGNNNNAVQMTNHIKNRINLRQDTFGDIEYIRVFQFGKKDGAIEKDTVGELKFKDSI